MREEEIQRYEQMLAEDPNSRAFAPLAEAYRKAGDLDKALAIAQTGLRIHPDYIGGLVVEGRVLLEKGDYKKARDSLARAVKDAPENLTAQKSLAKTAMALGENDVAAQALKAAILLSPDDDEIKANLDRVEQAAAKASKALGQVYDPVPDMEIVDMVSSGTGELQVGVPLSGEPGEETGMVPRPEKPEEPVDFVPFPTPEEVPEGLLPVEEPEIATETLADLYADQGEPEKAARIYRQLLDSDPAADEVASKLNGLDDKGSESAPAVEVISTVQEGETRESEVPREDPVETLEVWLKNVERMRRK